MHFVVQKNSNPLVALAVSKEELDSYPEADWLHDPASLRDALAAGKQQKYLKADGTSVLDMTSGEKATVDSSELEEARDRHFSRIDGGTRELISKGFEFPAGSGKLLSLSDQAQKNMLGVHSGIAENRAAGTLGAWESVVFPLKFNTLDDRETVAITDVTMYLDFYNAAFLRVRTLQDGGTLLKDQIRSAATIPDMEAVIDNRV